MKNGFNKVRKNITREETANIKDQHLLSSNYTLNTKTTFPLRIFLKILPFKTFPKCSLDARNIATLSGHSSNIPGILRAGWESTSVQH